MRDCRAVSKELMDELKDGGFKDFIEYVKKNKNDLVLCFRGNSTPKYVAIYYKNHYVWKLSITKNKELKVTISFNHARYTNNWKEELKKLYENYNFNSVCTKNKLKEKYNLQKEEFFTGNKLNLEGLTEAFKKGLDSSDGYLTVTKKSYDKDFVEGSGKILRHIIDDHFTDKFDRDEFKGIDNVIHPNKIEKKRQHDLYLKNDNSKDGLFIYDLEFTQPKAKELRLQKNQPDMLGIRFEKGKPKTLAIIEVKCTKAVMDGKSGLNEHLEKMKEYIEKKEISENRRKEVVEIMNQYNNLNLRNAPQIEEFDIKSIPFELGIFLTDDAIEEYEKKNYSSFNKHKPQYDEKNKILDKENNKFITYRYISWINNHNEIKGK